MHTHTHTHTYIHTRIITSAPTKSACVCIKRLFAVIPPSTRIFVICRPASFFMAVTTSTTYMYVCMYVGMYACIHTDGVSFIWRPAFVFMARTYACMYTDDCLSCEDPRPFSWQLQRPLPVCMYVCMYVCTQMIVCHVKTRVFFHGSYNVHYLYACMHVCMYTDDCLPCKDPRPFPFSWQLQHPLPVCMCICMYVCMHVCTQMIVCHVKTRVLFHGSCNVHYLYVCMYVCIYVFMYICMYVYIYVCIYVCMYLFMHVCMYVHRRLFVM